MDESESDEFDSILVEMKRNVSNASMDEYVRISDSFENSLQVSFNQDDQLAPISPSNPPPAINIINNDDIIRFNIGGCTFSTRRCTLSNSPLETFINNNQASFSYRQIENEIFIDRNPEYFSTILDYLRSINGFNEFIIPLNIDLNRLRLEAFYFELNGLVDLIDNQLNSMRSLNKEVKTQNKG